jgi:lipopolysaccharide assembly outer membrane protein LptD (OstA)
MKRVLLLLCLATFGSARQAAPSRPAPQEWTLSARQETVDGPAIHLRGDAEMRSAGMRFRADAIDFERDKAKVQLTGHARVETKDGTIDAAAVDYDLNSGRARIRGK